MQVQRQASSSQAVEQVFHSCRVVAPSPHPPPAGLAKRVAAVHHYAGSLLAAIAIAIAIVSLRAFAAILCCRRRPRVYTHNQHSLRPFPVFTHPRRHPPMSLTVLL